MGVIHTSGNVSWGKSGSNEKQPSPSRTEPAKLASVTFGRHFGQSRPNFCSTKARKKLADKTAGTTVEKSTEA